MSASRIAVCAGLLVSAVFATPHPARAAAAPIVNLISLAASREAGVPGSIAQIKVSVTEPKPIATGTGHLVCDTFDALVGIAVMGSNDTVGVALVQGNDLQLSVNSPSGSFGTSLDYPILTIAGHIPDSTPMGTTLPFDLGAFSLQLNDPTGAPYLVETKSGYLTTTPGVVISNVIPGSALVPAGGVISVFGTNFTPQTRIALNNTTVSETRYISPNQIDVVPATDVFTHGLLVKARNKDGSTDQYYSYQRTTTDVPSTDPVMQYVMPLLPPVSTTSATVALPNLPFETYGIALQNIGTDDASASVELLDADGNTTAVTTLAVPSSRYVVRELSELYGILATPPFAIRVTSTIPIEVLGIGADEIQITARPIPAQ